MKTKQILATAIAISALLLTIPAAAAQVETEYSPGEDFSAPSTAGGTVYFFEQEWVNYEILSGDNYVYAESEEAEVNIDNDESDQVINCAFEKADGASGSPGAASYAVGPYNFNNTPAYPVYYWDAAVYWLSGGAVFAFRFSDISSNECNGSPERDFGGWDGSLQDNDTWNWVGTNGI